MNIAFDTNIYGAIASPEDYKYLDNIEDCKLLNNAITENKIFPFLSSASLSLEALSHSQRIDEFFREWATKSSGITIPTPSDKRIEIVNKTLALGFKVLHVPRVALGEMVNIGKEFWAQDLLYDIRQRQERTTSFMEIHGSNGLPKLKDLGTELARMHDLFVDDILRFPRWPDPYEFRWIEGIVAEFDKPLQFDTRKAFTKHVREIIAEMTDIDTLASVYGYGFSLFCTNDRSKGTGIKGILHQENFNNLKQNYEIEVITPSELLEKVPH